jgi:hypothetical protein
MESANHLRRSLNFSGSALLLASAQRRWAATDAVRPLKPTLARGPSMKSPLLDMPASLSSMPQLKTPSTRITTLRNGVRVATEETYGQATAMGVFIDAGSRNETFETNGTTHVLQRMGFKVHISLARTRAIVLLLRSRSLERPHVSRASHGDRQRATGRARRSCRTSRRWALTPSRHRRARPWSTRLKW